MPNKGTVTFFFVLHTLTKRGSTTVPGYTSGQRSCFSWIILLSFLRKFAGVNRFTRKLVGGLT